MRRLVAILLAFASVAVSNLVGTSAADNEFEKCFRSKVNVERTSRGIPGLTNSEPMNIIARRHSEEIAAQGTIYHNDDLPNEPGVKPFAAVGENVGMGSDCEIIHKAFMDSPGHKKNILDRDYKKLGVGVTERDGTIYVVELFYAPAMASSPPPTKPKSKPTCVCM